MVIQSTCFAFLKIIKCASKLTGEVGLLHGTLTLKSSGCVKSRDSKGEISLPLWPIELCLPFRSWPGTDCEPLVPEDASEELSESRLVAEFSCSFFCVRIHNTKNELQWWSTVFCFQNHEIANFFTEINSYNISTTQAAQRNFLRRALVMVSMGHFQACVCLNRKNQLAQLQ